MKNLILSLFMVVMSTTMYSQIDFDVWQTVDVTDEFGDPTGESVTRMFVEGKFSNSATINSDLIAKIVDYGESVLIDLFEYSSPPSATLCYDGCLGEVSVKRADGTVESYECYALDMGGVYFNKPDFLDLIHNGGGEEVKVFIAQRLFSDYGGAMYSFKIITQ